MEELKTCKYCQSEINKKAKICPNCRKKQGGKGKFIIVGVIIFFILVGALGGNDDEPKQVSNNEDSSNLQQSSITKDTANKENEKSSTEVIKEEKTSFGIGDTASLKDINVTLASVTESEGEQYNKPADGKVFLLCEFLIENNSKSDITVSSIISFEAYCDDFSINQSFTGILLNDKGQLDGSVASGKKMNGVIAYEVPVDWKELEINFTPSFWGKEMTFIATK